MFIRISSVVVLVCLLLAARADARSARAEESPVAMIDVHAHLVPGPGLSFDAALESAIRTMDRFGVEKAILMSPPRTAGIKWNYDAADFRTALARYPDRFGFLAGGGTLNPRLHSHADPSGVSEKLQRAFAAEARRLIDDGALGFGEMSSLHISLSDHHGYNFVPADHPLLLTMADIAAERGVPIDLHMDAVASEMSPPAQLAGFPNNPPRFPATLPALERLLSHNRRAKIVWAHGGTDHLGDFDPKTIETLMDKHPNLFLSLKVSGPRAPTKSKLFSGKSLDPAWRSLLMRHPDKFVIGTDNFYADAGLTGSGPLVAFSKMTVPRLQATIAFLRLLPTDLARKIGRDNAVHLYHLNAQQTPPASTSSQVENVPTSEANKGLCREGNMEHCKTLCSRGKAKACARLRH